MKKNKLTKEEKLAAKQQAKENNKLAKQKEKQRLADVRAALKNAKTKQEKKAIKKEARKNAPPMMNKTTLVNLLIVCMVGLVTGVSVGIYLRPRSVDPNRYNFEVSALMDDVSAIRTESATKSPEQLGATKCCVLAFDTTFKCPRVSVVGVGSVKSSGVTQSINARTIRMDDQIFYENVSVSSLVKALNRYYVDGQDVKHYGGSKSGNTINWSTTHDNTGDDDIKTVEQYKSKFGSTLNEYMTYIVSSKTVVTASGVTKNASGNYVFNLTLDKSKAVVNYVKTMKATGNLKSYPDFTSNPEISVEMDAQFRIIKFTSYEKYSVFVFGENKSVGTLTNTFTYDQDFEIPAITDKTYI